MSLTFATVVVSGVAATVFVTPILGVLTVAVIFVMSRGVRAEATSHGGDTCMFPELPSSCRDVVEQTMRQLRDSDARRLLLSVLVAARPIFATRESMFEAGMENTTRANVAALIRACCDTATELRDVDVAAANAPVGDPAQRVASARGLLSSRMKAAVEALSSLYLAGVEHGSPASDRVSELVQEISADGRARRQAAAEMQSL